MLATNVLWHTSEHCKAEALFYKVVTVNTWSNRIEDQLINVGLFRQSLDLNFILVSNLNNVFIAESSDVVSLNDSLENWESVFDVSSIVKFIDEDTGDLNFISRPSSVNKIVKDEDFLLSWYSTWRHGSRGLLHRPFLVVSVDGFVIFNEVWTVLLANDALTQELLSVIRTVVVEWALQILACLASVVHFLKLWEDLGSFGDNTSDLDQGIQMHLSEIPQLVFNRKVFHSDEDFVVNLVVVWVHFTHNVRGYVVDDVKHQLWLFS